MQRLTVTEGAARGLERCRRCLVTANRPAARRAAEAIRGKFVLRESRPEIGRPFPEDPDLRELLIGIGESGYVALYRHEAAEDAVCVLAFRRQKEAGY